MAMICVVDTLWTVVAIAMGLAAEANPLMRNMLELGFGAFVAFKFMTFLPALTIMEHIRTTRPRMIQMALRAGIVLYLGVYVVGTLKIHGWAF